MVIVLGSYLFYLNSGPLLSPIIKKEFKCTVSCSYSNYNEKTREGGIINIDVQYYTCALTKQGAIQNSDDVSAACEDARTPGYRNNGFVGKPTCSETGNNC
ncbi:hypothetical protein J4423_01930 [Candidatus Pacearchaeota archaeon]|nr:hypothetical protein [Candidatus Pacearchaeota archaeon]